MTTAHHRPQWTSLRRLGDLRALAMVAILSLSSPPAAMAFSEDVPLQDGWWVVVQTVKETAPQMDDIMAAVWAKVDGCNLEAFQDNSMNFVGFKTGLIVFVLRQAFKSEAEAQPSLKQVQGCFPGAFLQRGRYLQP